MKKIFFLFFLLLTSCTSWVKSINIVDFLNIPDEPEPYKKPPALLPHPALRIFECDAVKCNQIFVVKKENGGSFFLEGAYEKKVVLDFGQNIGTIFLRPSGPVIHRMIGDKKVSLTPFSIALFFPEQEVFVAKIRKIYCGENICDYILLQQPTPIDFEAEFYVSYTSPAKK